MLQLHSGSFILLVYIEGFVITLSPLISGWRHYHQAVINVESEQSTNRTVGVKWVSLFGIPGCFKSNLSSSLSVSPLTF